MNTIGTVNVHSKSLINKCKALQELPSTYKVLYCVLKENLDFSFYSIFD